MKSFMIIFSLLAMCACAVNKEDKKLSYDFTENGCKTNAHEFSSQQEYCDALKNDDLNNHCASSMRYDQFKQSCPGQSWN